MLKTNLEAFEYALTLRFAALEGLISNQEAFESLVTMVCVGCENLSEADVLKATENPMVKSVITVNDLEKKQAIINVTRRMV